MLDQSQIEFIARRAKEYNPSKQAFSCIRGKGCSKDKCPAWLDLTWIMEDKRTGEKVKTPIVGCQFILRPIFDADIIETTYRNIDKSADVRKEIERYSNKLEEYTKETTAKIKQGLVAIMKFIGISDINKVLEENERLKIENETLKEEKLLNA